ncbi:HGGxSTG domain-containing protein [Bacillus sp. FSL K6-6038]|nr:HGGxSTG domain-containing protein [Bacillus pseudomycoides]
MQNTQVIYIGVTNEVILMNKPAPRKGARPSKLDDPRLKALAEKVAVAKEKDNQEALKKLRSQLKKEPTICGAIKGDGRLCLRKPHIKEDGSTNGKCPFHGGKSTGQKTEEGRKKAMANLNPRANLIHGAYSKEFKEMLSQGETDLYNGLMDYYIENYEVDPFNLVLVDRFAINTVKSMRMDSKDFLRDSKAYNDTEVKLIRFAESLGLNQKFKQSKEHKDNASKVDLNALFDMGNEQ